MKTSINPENWAKESSARSAIAPLTFSDQHVLNRLTSLLREKADDLSRTILNGGLSLEGYRELAGELHGIETAQSMLRRVQREVNQGGETVEPKGTELYVS